MRAAIVAMALGVALLACQGTFLEEAISYPVSDSQPFSSPEDAPCDCPKGNVSDCCCTFAELEVANTEQAHSLLKQVVATPFFAHFKVDLCSTCPFWDDQPMCTLRDCSVCECEAPPLWAHSTDCKQPEAQVEDQVSTNVSAHILAGWPELETAGDRQNATAVVVDLRKNPEKYTGYTGDSAARVWRAIHEENAFQPAEALGELLADQRLYNRVLSGLHSSISLHIAKHYCLERQEGASYECAHWGVNLAEARRRVLSHPDRVENLYVAFAVLLRAVAKAGDSVSAAVPTEDSTLAESLREWQEQLLPEVRRLGSSCPQSFDEGAFDVSVGPRAELHRRLGQLREVMQCVGCDRCKLWGTLQSLGVSTAFKVLFPEEEGAVSTLTRQEAVALVHTFERLSASLAYTQELRAVMG